MIQFILLLLGSAHGFYISFALLTKNNKQNNANLLLALLVFSFTLRLFFEFLDIAGFLVVTPHLIELDAPIAFLFGPLFYLYVQKLTSPSFYKVNYLHFLPFILAFTLSIPFYLQSSDFKLSWFMDTATPTQVGQFYILLFGMIFILIKLILTTFYLIKIYQRLLQHRVDIADIFYSVEKISLTWLIRLFGMISFLFCCWVIKEAIDYNYDLCMDNSIGAYCDSLEAITEDSIQLVELGLVICIYLISIYGLKQPTIFISDTKVLQQKTQHVDVQKLSTSNEIQSINQSSDKEKLGIKDDKYQKSSLTKELSAKVFQEICNFIDQQALYLEPELSLSQLSQQSGFSKHHLSQAINQCANKSFFDFINCLRVEQAKLLLHTKGKMNVLDISLAAGFNSRSSFYNAFKKHTQLTPSQFKKLKSQNA